MDALLPGDLWAVVEPLLPPEPGKLMDGRPRVADRAGAAGIVLVLRAGPPWRHLPRAGVGCGGKTRGRRPGVWQAPRVWAALHRAMLACALVCHAQAERFCPYLQIS